MRTVPFRESSPILLDGSGAGMAKLGPISAREQWHDMTVSVSANQNPTNEAQCLIYTGDSNTKVFRDGCVDGSSGDSTQHATGTLRCGEYVWAVWTGGDAGVYATLTVEGMKDV